MKHPRMPLGLGLAFGLSLAATAEAATRNSLETHGTHTVLAPAALAPGNGTGSDFAYIGKITSNTAGQIATVPGSAGKEWFTERASGIVALYQP